MKNVVLFSGLGANQQIFDFLDLGEVNKTYINWPVPGPGESLSQYAKRITLQIPYERPILIGVSFGGMVATEISKLIPTEKVIVISSAGSHKAIPFYYKLIGLVGLQKLLPARVATRPGKLLYSILGIHSPEHRNLLTGILSKTDPTFLRRAVDMILNWRNDVLPKNFHHIHGTRDLLLPLRVTCHCTVTGGGHFMIVDRAKEVSQWIQQVINSPTDFADQQSSAA
jgi:pimeloyl-ACP methyl ester carboxylesterase